MIAYLLTEGALGVGSDHIKAKLKIEAALMYS
jgi:hypothetical protein